MMKYLKRSINLHPLKTQEMQSSCDSVNLGEKTRKKVMSKQTLTTLWLRSLTVLGDRVKLVLTTIGGLRQAKGGGQGLRQKIGVNTKGTT